MLFQMTELARRIRIRSWKDLVLIIVGGVLYALTDYLVQRFLPQIPDKVRDISLRIIFIIAIVIFLFAVDY